MKQRLLLFLFVFALFGLSVQAVVQEHSTKIFAVTNDGKGLQATLDLRIEPGTGKIFSGVDALVGTSTQNAFKVALDLAKNYSSETSQHNYYFSIESNASIVDGPSAGAATSLLLVTMLQDKRVPATVAMTGTIDEQGGVGAVGGVFEKAKAAADSGVKLFMVPKGEARQVARTANGVESVNLIEYAPQNWGMKVVEVSTLDEALQLAFSNIESIDINQQIEQSQELFVPEAIPYHPQLEPLHDITATYLQQARNRLEEAKNALNNTIISDNQLVSVMFESLAESENVLDEAQNLYDQNFLYSSANFAFTAIVNANLVKDIAENPSILNSNSTVFQNKLSVLQQRLDQLKLRINSKIIVDQVDWQIAAQQRWLWAQNNVNELKNTQTIVITGDGTEPIGINQVQLDQLRNYEFAAAWSEIADVFSQELQNGTQQITETSAFKNAADQALIDAENKAPLIGDTERSDIQRRLEGAKTAQSLQWYLPMQADAESVSSLVEGEQQIQGKSIEELTALLDQKIQALDAEIPADQPFVWARIYLDHARYFQQAVAHYKEQNRTSEAINAAQSGISVAFLAESAFSSQHAIYTQMQQLGSAPYNPEPFQPLPNPAQPIDWTNNYWAIGGGILILALIIVIILLVISLRKTASENIPDKPGISDAERKENRHFLRESAELDKQLVQGSLSRFEYNQRKSQLLEKLSPTTPPAVMSVQDINGRVKKTEEELQELKQAQLRGELSKEQFQERFSKIQQKVRSNKSLLQNRSLPAIEKNNVPALQSTSRGLQDLAEEIKKKPVSKPVARKKTSKK